MPAFLKLITITAAVSVGPDRYHEMYILIMKFFSQLRYIGKPVGIRGFVSPASILPGHPVLNDTVQSQSAFTELPGNGNQFRGALIPLFGLDIPENPAGRQCGQTGTGREHAQDISTVLSAEQEIRDPVDGVQLKGKGVSVSAVFHGTAGFNQKSPAIAAQKKRDWDLHVVLVKPF